MQSTTRFQRKSSSPHLSAIGGGVKKATSTGVMTAVKTSAQVVIRSQYAIILLLRGSMVV